MARDVVLRKIAQIRQLIRDLEKHASKSQEEVEAAHYEIERIFELLVMAAVDLLSHLLNEAGHSPTTYRDTFKVAGEIGWLPQELAATLQKAAGMRNILVHLYDEIDYVILRNSIQPAIVDFAQFANCMLKRLD